MQHHPPLLALFLKCVNEGKLPSSPFLDAWKMGRRVIQEIKEEKVYNQKACLAKRS